MRKISSCTFMPNPVMNIKSKLTRFWTRVLLFIKKEGLSNHQFINKKLMQNACKKNIASEKQRSEMLDLHKL
jgi:hypothetical protein